MLSQAQALPNLIIDPVAENVAFAVSTGHLNHANLRGESETKGYVRSLPKKRMWGVCVCVCVCVISSNFYQGT